jgi:acetolactate synthase-1/3 small subunit
MKKPLSAYSEPTKAEEIERHIMVVWVDNEAGVLARVSGLFSGRGYNIESLAVAQVDDEKNISRITIATNGTNSVIEQIKAQLLKLIPVYKVACFTVDDKGIF